jgi:NAD(P)-dependent dehydrogenase (short-subunit alcohol dehydrogenase family)
MAEGPKKLDGRTTVVVGGGQTPGATVGNGRAACLLYAQHGARVLVADRDLASAEETAALVRADGGVALALEVDVRCEDALERMCATSLAELGALDVLHYNVGVSQAGGDAAVTDVTAEAFTFVMEVNLRGMVLASKHALPHMRKRGSGVIVNIGSIAARIDYPRVAYKTSKAGAIALTEHLAITNATYGIRANAILPGLMDTPMAVEYKVTDGATREDVVADRARKTPLKGRVGTGWDVAHAALFLASDDAHFITGATLTVDGGQTLLCG